MPRLAVIVPTIYLLVVFVTFQTITLGSGQADTTGSTPLGSTTAFVLTLPWSLLGKGQTGRLVYLPMVVGAPLNAAILYFLLGRVSRR